MTKLALYDKHDGPADRAANDYFRHDYIYRKNLGTRLSVGFGGMIILAIYWLRVIFMDGVDVFELHLQTHIFESIVFILALMAVYSLIGTIQGTREYYLIQKRLERYQGMLRYLERVDERGRIRVKTPVNPAKEAREKTAPHPRVRRERPGVYAEPRMQENSELVRRSDTRTRPAARPRMSPDDAPLVRRNSPQE